MANDNATPAEPRAAQYCNLQLVYLLDLSFEAPNSPAVLFAHEQPLLTSAIETRHRLRDKDTYEVEMDVRVQVKGGEKTLFLIEVKQGGIFEVKGYSSEATWKILKTRAPEMLFPYIRELISSMASRGGFPRLQLRPVDFEAVYAEALARRRQEKEKEG